MPKNEDQARPQRSVFTVLSSGKIKRAQAYKRHILTKKSRKRPEQAADRCLCAQVKRWPDSGLFCRTV